MRKPVKAYSFTTKQLSVGYDKRPLIKDIEITLARGEILCLIGPNGAGKSTVLKSIAGQLQLLGGNVYLGESSLSELNRKELSRKMSVVFTQKVRAEMKTCRDVVATGRYPYTGRFGILSGEDERIVEDVMALTQITEIGKEDFNKISDGQKQRVMLARAICQEPEIIVLDEPTSYLDIRYKLEFLAILKDLREKKGLTVIMSLHELELAKIIADKILCLKGESVEKYGTPQEIFEIGFIRRLYGIEEDSLLMDQRLLAYVEQIGSM